MNGAILVGAIGIVTVLAGWGGWLRLGRRARMMRSPEEAAEAAETAMPDLSVANAVLAEDGRAALVLGTDGRVVVVTSRGARPAARTIAWSALRQGYEGMLVETGERRFGTVLLKGVSALDVRRLGLFAEIPSA